MNALPPSAAPAACVRGAERRSPRPIGPCAGTAAKSGAMPSAQGAQRPRRPAFFTAAETRNGAARSRATGAGGAIGHGRTLARARAVAHIHSLKAARCANRAAWQGVTGSGNNMPRGGPLACAAGAARPRLVMRRAATGAPGARAIVKSCVWADHAAARSWRSPSTNLTPRMISARWFDPSSFFHFL